MKSPEMLYLPVDGSPNQIHSQITFFKLHTAKLFIKMMVDIQE